MAITIRRLAIALLSALTVALALPAPAASAQADTFACDPGFYQVIAGQFAQFDPGAGSYQTLGPDNANYNAMGYRIADGYMYAVSGPNLHRINAFGDVTVIATLGANTRGYTGDFGDDGLLHVSRGGADWTTIDVDTFETTSIAALSVPAGMADITNVNGVFYGLSGPGDLIRVDPVALTVDNVGPVQGLPASSVAFGAAWSTAGGNLYVGRNSGEIYQITGYSTPSPVATQVGTAPPTNSNDGASCSLAPPPPGLADVDGPEPETQPSTPAAQAAAEQYEQTYVPTPIQEPSDDPADPEPDPVDGDPDETYTVDPDAIEGGEACGASPVEVRPARDLLQPITTVDVETLLYSSGFDDASASGWQFLSGDWVMTAGTLDQTTPCDFDATALLATHTVSDFRWTTSFVGGETTSNGGLLFHQSSPNTRSGASLVDFADNGTVLRWGSYDSAGFYTFHGARAMPAIAVGQVVRLSVEVHGTSVMIWVDDVALAHFEAPEEAGMVGLVATKSVLSFEHAELRALPPEPAESEKDNAADDAPAEDAPADDAPADDAPADDAPAGDAPAEDAAPEDAAPEDEPAPEQDVAREDETAPTESTPEPMPEEQPAVDNTQPAAAKGQETP